ncbi:hypothetical protein BaRGS_00021110, partial [Batillaria attramentaria]
QDNTDQEVPREFDLARRSSTQREDSSDKFDGPQLLLPKSNNEHVYDVSKLTADTGHSINRFIDLRALEKPPVGGDNSRQTTLGRARARPNELRRASESEKEQIEIFDTSLRPRHVQEEEGTELTLREVDSEYDNAVNDLIIFIINNVVVRRRAERVSLQQRRFELQPPLRSYFLWRSVFPLSSRLQMDWFTREVCSEYRFVLRSARSRIVRAITLNIGIPRVDSAEAYVPAVLASSYIRPALTQGASNISCIVFSQSCFTAVLSTMGLEKDDRDNDMVTQGSGAKQRPSSASKASASSSSNKAAKSAGRNSRRDSIGIPTLLEPPPSKQRRGSLQLPFREHFFNSQSKSADVRSFDDPFGSLRSRRGQNLSIDDTYSIPSTSPQGTLTFSEGGKKPRSQKLSVVSLFANNSSNKRLHERRKPEALSQQADISLDTHSIGGTDGT